MKNKYFNRELSWLEFNARVLNESKRKEIPLLERLKFLAITSSNFDEFFQVRVASIKRQLQHNIHTNDQSGYSPKTLLAKISQRCHILTKQLDDTLSYDILPSLAKEGIVYVNAKKLTAAQKSYTESIFRHEIFPLLTPLRTDSAEFPHIGNLRLTAAFLLEPMEGVKPLESALKTKLEQDILALVQVPSSIPPVVWLPASEDGKKQFTVVEDIISLFGRELFPGYTVKEYMLFKVARDADFAVDEDSGENFIQAMEQVLIKRQSSFAVRMTCNNSSAKIQKMIQEKLELTDQDVYTINNVIEPSSFLELTSSTENPSLLYPEWKNFYPDDFPEKESFWNTLRQKDILLHVPYQKFDPVVKFVKAAAKDPNVLAIKMTLYRTGSDSPIVQALKKAAQNGKQVTAFVELKARFDEKRNISWALELENAGVIVVYGVVNLKVHAKACLVIRRESDGIRRYAHFSTGNYNQKTAKIYQDLSIFTSNHDLTSDATLFFNVISGYSALQTMHNLYMAPVTLKTRLLELIEREIRLSTPENPGLIMAKMNSLCHPQIINALYKASCAGVKILLNVRGICTLVPGVKDLSENIYVISIIDRYLEHSRIFYFKNDGEEELYLSSADWMERNLDKRIELMIPLRDSNTAKSVKEILNLYFQDNTHSHVLQKDGSWKIKTPEKKEQIVRVQEVLYEKYKKKDATKKSAPKIEFTVRRNG